MAIDSRTRLDCLDGLRGWGALAVLLFHVFVLGFPISPAISTALRPIFMFNGVLAVWVFFVVSGVSLSIGFCKTRDKDVLVKIALGRYIRLAVPVFVVCLVLHVFLLLRLVPDVDQRLPAFRDHLLSIPDVLQVIRFSLFDVFFHYSAVTTLIPPLWTMEFELWGSCLVLGTLFVVGRLNRRLEIYIVLCVVAFFIHPINVAFLVGVIFAEIRSGSIGRKATRSLSIAAAVLFLPTLGACMYLPWDGDKYPAPYLMAGCAITFCVIFNDRLSRLLSSRTSRFLGKISFPLYLIHAPLFFVYASNVYRLAGDVSDGQKLLLDLSIVAVCIGAACMLVSADRLGIAMARRFSDYMMQPRAPTRFDKGLALEDQNPTV